MIKLVRTAGNLFGIFAPEAGVVMEPGLLNDAVDQLRALGVTATEQDFAFTEMFNKGHNCAVFGIGRLFIYTTNVTVIPVRGAPVEAGLIVRGVA